MRTEPMVLMYHSVEPYVEDPYRITVSPLRFERQMRWMRRRGLRGVSVRELLAARAAGTDAGLVGLTFDDGYEDFVTRVMPVLARYGWTATVYIVAGALGGYNAWDSPGPRKDLMTGDDVRRAADAGIEIGSHSLSHCRLTGCTTSTLADEIGHSRIVLSDLTGLAIDGFCYPYGAAGVREVDMVRAAGYGYACAVGPGDLAGPLALPRTYIGDQDSAPRLYAKWIRHGLRHRRPSMDGAR
jgi:peptidoglycan/xylan/chitin deacetylase (PgdA/CDA1 family)